MSTTSNSPVRQPSGGAYAYFTGMSAEGLTTYAAEDGSAAISDPDVVGRPNQGPHIPNRLVHGHRTAVSVIGHELRGQLQRNTEAIESAHPAAQHAQREAVRAIGEQKSREIDCDATEHRRRQGNLAVPSRKASRAAWLLPILLCAGEVGLVKTSYMLFGLSSEPLIGGLGLTNELSLAAFSTLLAVVVLADVAGVHLRKVYQRHREATGAPPRADFATAGIALVLVVGCLAGLTALRADYLAESGVAPNDPAFFAIQSAIVAAALAVAFFTHNPIAQEWLTARAALAEARDEARTAIDTAAAATARYNALVEERDTLVAQAAHHALADAAHMQGQQLQYFRDYIVSQHEPASEELFPAADLLSPTISDEAEGAEDLLRRVVGLTEPRTYERLEMTEVFEERAAADRYVRWVRDRMGKRQVEAMDLPEWTDEDHAIGRAAVRPTGQGVVVEPTRPPLHAVTATGQAADGSDAIEAEA